MADIKAQYRSYAATDDSFLVSIGSVFSSDVRALTTGFTAARATFVASNGWTAANITITATVDYSTLTFGVVGVRLDGVTTTENITGPNNTTVSGVVLFRSISAITTTVGPTGGIHVGIGRLMGATAGRIRGISYNTASHAGTINVRNGLTATDTLVARIPTSTLTNNVQVQLPGKGIVCDRGVVVDFTTGVVGITVFHE